MNLGLRRQAKSATPLLLGDLTGTIQKRCRRCALPAQSMNATGYSSLDNL
jgi:hypothetical protein